MYYLLSYLVGAVIPLMLLANGKLTGSAGVYVGTVIIHIVGLLLVLAILVRRRQRVRLFREGVKASCYLGGVIGVFTTISNNYCFGKISLTSIVALDLLGEIVISLIIDTFGLFGMKKQPFTPGKLVGIGLLLIGIVMMLVPFERAAFLPVMFALLAGISVVLSRSYNGVLTERTDVMTSTFYNYVTGLVTAVIVLALLGRNEPMLRGGPVPKNVLWYTGGFLGVFTVSMLNRLIYKVPALYLTLLSFIGQVSGGMIIDAIQTNGLDRGSLIGGVFCTLGLAADLWFSGERKKENERNEKTN